MTIQKFSLKNLRNQTILFIIITSIMVYFLADAISDTYNTCFGPFVFNFQRAEKEIAQITGEGYKRMETSYFYTQMNDSSLYLNKYSAFGKYIFEIQPDEIYDWEWGYSISGSYQTVENRLVLCEKEGAFFFAKIEASVNLANLVSLEGVFVPLSDQELGDLYALNKSYQFTSPFYEYILDTTQTFSYDRSISVVITAVWAAIELFFLLRILRQYINRNTRYIYRKLSIFDVNDAEIDKQLQDAKLLDKRYEIQDWVITPRLFRTKITRK